MRNLKKILALVLALVMSFSLVTVSSAAFTDAEDIDAKYAEAADVLVDLGVIQGRTHADGTADFAPLATIKRAEVAAIIYRIVTGDVEGKQVGMFIGYGDFTDVPADYWGAGYIGFCANGKYVEGHGDGTFGPEDPVTGYQALVMVLRAIGYGEMIRLAGGDWQITSAARAKALHIIDNVDDALLAANAPRQLVAEIVYRALMVRQAIYTPALNEVITKASLGEEIFNLKVVDGLVIANECANLGDDDDFALAANRTEIIIDTDGDGDYIDEIDTFTLAGTTGLNDLGETRYFVYLDAKNVKDRTVLYVADSGLNTVYETSTAATAAGIASAAKKAGAIWNADTAEYVDFDEAAVTGNQNGNYVKVVDNNDDGYADYVLKTTYVLNEVYHVTSKGAITLYDESYVGDAGYVYSDNFAAEDVVVTTGEIDGNVFVNLADSFTGVTTTVSYKNSTITVEGEDYKQSGIINLTGYGDVILDVAEKTEYTYFMDNYGFIRAYKLPEGVDANYALLTETYTTRKNNTALITTTTGIAEVTIQDGKTVEMVVNNYLAQYPTRYAGVFFETADVNGNMLVEFPGAVTNIAAISGVGEDSLSLNTATTPAYDKNGALLGWNAIDYVGLDVQAFTKADKSYDGTYAGDPVTVNAVHNTEYYIVNLATGAISYFTDYAELPAISADLVSAAYTVSSNVNNDANKDPYWVADVVVIELTGTIPGMYDTIDLVYYNNSKTTAKVYNLDVIDVLNPELGNNIYVNRTWGAQMTANIPSFYAIYNSDKEMVGTELLDENFNAFGVFADTIDRINAVSNRGDYITLESGKTLKITGVPVFVIAGKNTYETSITYTRYKANGVDVLSYGNEGDDIIYVCNPVTGALSYIVLANMVDEENSTTVSTAASGLWTAIDDEQTAAGTALTGLDGLFAELFPNYVAGTTNVGTATPKAVVIDEDLRAGINTATQIYYSRFVEILTELATYTDSVNAGLALANTNVTAAKTLADAKVAAFAMVNLNVAKGTGYTEDWSGWTPAEIAAVKDKIDAATAATAIDTKEELAAFQSTVAGELTTAKGTAKTNLVAAIVAAVAAHADADYLTTDDKAEANIKVETGVAAFITAQNAAIDALTVKADVEAYVAAHAADITAAANAYVAKLMDEGTLGAAKKAGVAEILAMAKNSDYASASAMSAVTSAINTGKSNVLADTLIADVTAEVAATKGNVATAAVAAAKTAINTTLQLAAGSTNDVATVTAKLTELANKDVTITVTMNGEAFDTEAHYSIVITSKLDATKTATVADYVVTVATAG